MKVCRDLSEENQQLRVQVVDCDNQLLSQLYHVQSLEEALQRSQSQVKTLDEENQRLNSDLKVIPLNHIRCLRVEKHLNFLYHDERSD